MPNFHYDGYHVLTLLALILSMMAICGISILACVILPKAIDGGFNFSSLVKYNQLVKDDVVVLPESDSLMRVECETTVNAVNEL